MKQAGRRILRQAISLFLALPLLLSFPVVQEADAVSLDGILDGVFFVVDAVACGKEIFDGDTNLESCYAAVFDVGFFFLPFAVNTSSNAVKNLTIGGRVVNKADDVIDIYKSCDTLSDLAKAGFSVIDNADDLQIGKSIFGKYGDLVKIGSKGGKVEMHHLNPASLNNLFGLDTKDMLATAWSKDFHRLGADPGKITTKLNDLVKSVKQYTGGANSYSHLAFAKYISGIGDVYAEAGFFYSSLVKLDALASPGGLRWLEHLGVGANAAVKALNAARTNVMAYSDDTSASADEVIAQAMCSAIYDSTNDALCVQLYRYLTGDVELGEDVTDQFAGKELRLKSVESGGYVCAENNSTVHTCCGESCGIFEGVLTGDHWLGLRLKNGNWLSVQDRDYLRTTGSNLQAWECFKILQYGNDYFLLAQKNDCYVQVTDEVSRNLKAVRSVIEGLDGATWERFQIELVYPPTITGSTSGTSSGGSTSGGTSDIPTSGTAYVENQYYRNPNAVFTEGYYTGEWSNDAPSGYGKIVYADVDGDGKRYSISSSTTTYYATSYEGYFSNGLRYGEGTVYYEGGYRDEGTFYGAWAADKLVFEGKRWQCTDNVNGYWPWSIIAADTVSPKVENHGDWVSVKTSYTVSYNANGGSGAPSSQTKKPGTSLTLSNTQPTRSGYTFQGWATSSGGSVVYQPGSSYANDADLTLYAVWKKTAADSFDDVQQGSWFYDAVSWAGQQNITQGTALRTFSPELACTRGQAVTFLWRAAGCPRVASANPFTDVNKDDYYYAAVLWAKNSGITYGVTNDTFAPELMVNRAQFATMLYRFAGSAPVYGSTGFRDIPQGSYYTDAVKWCASYGITNGTTKTTFSPEQVCTRAQIVTFLFRFCNP